MCPLDVADCIKGALIRRKELSTELGTCDILNKDDFMKKIQKTNFVYIQ